MGGKSSSKSSTTSTSNVTDNRFGVETGGLGVSASGKGAVINLTDFDPSVVAEFENIASDVADTLGKGYESVGNVTSAVTGLSESVIGESLKIVSEASEDNAKEIAESTVKYLLAGVSLVAIAAMWIWGSK